MTEQRPGLTDMATEPQSYLDVDMFAFRPAEMAGILEARQLEPTRGSPLMDFSEEVDDSARAVTRQ